MLSAFARRFGWVWRVRKRACGAGKSSMVCDWRRRWVWTGTGAYSGAAGGCVRVAASARAKNSLPTGCLIGFLMTYFLPGRWPAWTNRQRHWDIGAVLAINVICTPIGPLRTPGRREDRRAQVL